MGDLAFHHTVPIGKHRCIVHRNYGHDDSGQPDDRTGFYEDSVPVYSDEDMAFGVRVRELRASFGLTLGDGARAAGLGSVVNMSELERGRARCDIEELRRRFEVWRASR